MACPIERVAIFAQLVTLSLTAVFAVSCTPPIQTQQKTMSLDGRLKPAVDAGMPTVCPPRADAPERLPDVRDEFLTADYWIQRAAELADVDQLVMTAADIAAHNQSLQQPRVPGKKFPFGHYRLDQPLNVERLERELGERIDWLNERFREGRYVGESGQRIPVNEMMSRTDMPALNPEAVRLQVVLDEAQLYCAPTTSAFYTASLDKRFNRNLCSMVRSQEPVQIVATWPNGMRLARTRYSYGWIRPDVRLSEPIPAHLVSAYVGHRKVSVTEAWKIPQGGPVLPMGTLVPPVEGAAGRIWVATAKGFIEHSSGSDKIRGAELGFSRRDFLQTAFRFIGQNYGLGGLEGGRDCSRLVMDTFGALGLSLPRHSRAQAFAGTFRVNIEPVENERERLLLMDAAARRGIVLLHFPGHIMLYLGRTEDGQPMALHAFAEYMRPCDAAEQKQTGRTETLMMVDRLTVSNLELGRGSSRRSFLERITHLTVLGQSAGTALQGGAQNRPAAPSPKPKKCKDSQSNAIYVSPEAPHSRGELRVMATRTTDPGPVGLTLYGPDGLVIQPELQVFGGPPYTYVARVEKPAAGRWHAVFGDGDKVHACVRYRVTRAPSRRETGSTSAWPVKRKWGEAPENLYGAFVESLFSHPLEEDLTWTNLQSLLQDRERNLLFDHFNKGEEKKLKLRPDCADLPYLLRGYFAWKLALPFGYRICNRGRTGRPPTCGDVLTNRQDRPEGKNDVEAFGHFARRKVQNGVHSASGRTHPKDEDTDYYPVELTRKALKPGTMYADPHGHILMIARWIPQTVTGYGTLLAADAQPDGTIGRRRFWRGSFLFSPETKDVGAGFKAFRPVIAHKDGPKTMSNRRLKKTKRFARLSYEQYDGSVQDFYDKMAALINPRPLDAAAMQLQLVDALYEAVSRRVVSVNNGEDFMAKRGFRAIDMPKGYSVFETTGPWEDFSTPARDMRLLISIDTVMGFVESIRRQPASYGLKPGEETEAAVRRVAVERDAALNGKVFEFTRSDGSKKQLSLADVAKRAKRFEMSYNPNDCVEIRWGAGPDDEEMASCQRRAPKKQQRRMRKYRQWFIDRTRPPR